MKNNKKHFIPIFLLLVTMGYCFLSPRAKYNSANILSELELPYNIKSWNGKDIQEEWDIYNKEKNFINQIIDRKYVNEDGGLLFLTILDTGNFHNPRVCAKSAGYKVKVLADREFHMPKHTFKAKQLYISHEEGQYLIIYWMCIDKEIVDWTTQKIKQLWYSLVHKKGNGLMVRIDIPVNKKSLHEAFMLANKFITELSQKLSDNRKAYLFGNDNKTSLYTYKINQTTKSNKNKRK